MRKKFSFIIPCYNCEKFIHKNIVKLINYIKRLNIKFEILLINDGSEDNTLLKLNLLKKRYRFIKIINNEKNTGKSYCIIQGLKKNIYKNVVLIDCDLPYFNSLKSVIYLLKKGEIFVTINRKLKQSKLLDKNLNCYQYVRSIVGKFIALVNLHILNISIEGGDTQAGLKGFKKIKNFNKIKFISKKFFFDLELACIYSKKKIKIKSIKTDFKIPDNSTIKIFDIRKNFSIIFELIKIIIAYK